MAPLGFDSQPAYSQPGGGYPPMQPGYPSSQPGYPTSQPGYPSYPGGPSYPGAQAPSYPGGGYPSQQPPSYPSSSNSWFDPVPQVPGGLPAHIQSNPNFQPNQPSYSGYQPTAPSNNTNTRDNQQLKNNKKQTEKSKQCQPKEVQPVDLSGFKTTVAYYLPGEDVAYISTFNGKNLTLSQFKQFITKKGQFR